MHQDIHQNGIPIQHPTYNETSTKTQTVSRHMRLDTLFNTSGKDDFNREIVENTSVNKDVNNVTIISPSYSSFKHILDRTTPASSSLLSIL